MNPNEEWVRTILACLKIRADQVRQPIGSMSGGERAKVALAALLVGEANLLLLDEPTNHLDIEAREALEATLAQYPGAILFVSHDRHFVEELGDARDRSFGVLGVRENRRLSYRDVLTSLPLAGGREAHPLDR